MWPGSRTFSRGARKICPRPRDPLELATFFPDRVISPFTRGIDPREKARNYAAVGIHEYRAVDPERRELSLHVLEGNSHRVEGITPGACGSRAVPGFEIRVD